MNKAMKWRKRARKWKRAAKACDRDYTTQMYRDNALLAWQGRVRERWERVFLASVTLETQPTVTMCKDSWTALRRAIEAEPKEET